MAVEILNVSIPEDLIIIGTKLSKGVCIGITDDYHTIDIIGSVNNNNTFIDTDGFVSIISKK